MTMGNFIRDAISWQNDNVQPTEHTEFD